MVAFTKKQNYRKNYKSNNAVKNAINKYKPPPKKPAKKYQVYNNKNAIMTLAKQVKSLQLSKLGPYQKRIEFFELDKEDMGNNNFNHTRPICFQLNDFTSDCKLHTLDPTSHVSQTMKGWSIVPSKFTGNLAKYNQFWATNDCEVSKLRYLPIKCEYTLTISTNMAEQDSPRWIRVDFVKPNKILPQTGSHALNLPEGIFSFSELLNGPAQPNKVNDINPLYWKRCHKPQWISLKANAGQTSATSVIRHKKFNIYFPNKVINVETDTPYSYANDSILTNISRKDQMWAVFSFDRQYSNTNNLKIGMTRTMHWRDEHGAAN
ncbi:MAG: putative capsid protein [Cressdnaviricota sp.]|nr:MAG: putative capsid protein [Cressdnaviricota sp.]